jgi:hypothetical protein
MDQSFKIKFYPTLISIQIILATKEDFKEQLELFIVNHLEKISNMIKCPVCWEDHYIIKQESCSHKLCIICYDKIMTSTALCPCCRRCWVCNRNQCICEEEASGSDDSDEDPYDYALTPGDDLSIPDFQGNNSIPTENLFQGRRWYNVETEKLYIYLNDRWRVEDEYLLNSAHWDSEINYGVRILRGGTDEELELNSDHNCKICGLQRTVETNSYIINRIRYENPYRNHRYYNGKIYSDEYCWGTDAFNGYGIDYCFMCHAVHDRMTDVLPFY